MAMPKLMRWFPNVGAVAAAVVLSLLAVASPAHASESSLVLPDLSRFTQTEWLLAASTSPAAIGFVLLQALVYAALLTLAGLFDLHRRNF